MRTIWKYTFYANFTVVLDMPVGARILPTLVSDESLLSVWAEVNLPEDGSMPAMEDRVLHVIGTGNPMPEHPVRYIGTTLSGPFVWHVYEYDSALHEMRQRNKQLLDDEIKRGFSHE